MYYIMYCIEYCEYTVHVKPYHIYLVPNIMYQTFSTITFRYIYHIIYYISYVNYNILHVFNKWLCVKVYVTCIYTYIAYGLLFMYYILLETCDI